VPPRAADANGRPERRPPLARGRARVLPVGARRPPGRARRPPLARRRAAAPHGARA